MSDHPKKLIEVALPLDEINAACKADKDRKTGTIRNLHKWFAPMPLPAWRALLYAALIDDPGDDEKRAYHLEVIKRLVASGADLPDPDAMHEARENLQLQFPAGVPEVLDPFCGGGSTLLEAQRLGLGTLGTDLNPVPVLITRTLTQVLPRVFNVRPLHPEAAGKFNVTSPRLSTLDLEVGSEPQFDGLDGLKADVKYFAEVIRAEAWTALERHYPREDGESVIAWMWARTGNCVNPACGIETILASSWWLSKKKADLAWIEPVVRDGQVHLEVRSNESEGQPGPPPKVGHGASFSCLACGEVITDEELERQAVAGDLGLRMTAVACERAGKRLYRAPSSADHLGASSVVEMVEGLDRIVATDGSARRAFEAQTLADLFTKRQALVLATFADLVADIHGRIIEEGGSVEWSNAVTAVLALAVGKMAQYGSSQSMITTPTGGPTRFNSGFGRNDLPMTWDFFEQNFFGTVGGTWQQVVETALQAVQYVVPGVGEACARDARVASLPTPGLVATDPPYFDAIGYADLSDYFYVWHRRALRNVFPDLYATLATPKTAELIASPMRHDNDKDAARVYFIQGFTQTFRNLQDSLADGLPLLVVYASKEQKGGRDEETRWSSILTAMLNADLEITGTWPIHGTGSTRMLGMAANVVATYVVMVTRPRPIDAGTCSLQDFNRALRKELRTAVEHLQGAGILPVDLAQAAIGPGMQVYSRYRSVLDQSGERVPVEQALRLINQALTEVLDEQEGELDPDSRFAVTLWEKNHWGEAPFGEADQVARPQGISVDDVVRAKVAAFPRAGFVQLLGGGDLDRGWSPNDDARPTAWEAVHHLADRLINGGGISDAGRLLAELGSLRDQAQSLVYRLHAIAARKGWTEDQERYNALIGSWSDLLAEAGRVHDNGDGLF